MKEAQPINLYNKNGHQLENYVGVANKIDCEEVFNVVSPQYKIVQHGEAIDAVHTAFDELGLKTDVKLTEMNDGARIQMQILFPEFVTDIDRKGDHIQMQALIDNSYNGTTGLRGAFGAFRLVCMNGMFVGDKVSSFYHKHTSGLDLYRLTQQMGKCISHYQDKFTTDLQSMLLKSLTPTESLALIDSIIKRKMIAAKYLEIAKNIIQYGGSFDIKNIHDVSNIWKFYQVLTETITHHVQSADTRRHFYQVAHNEMMRQVKLN